MNIGTEKRPKVAEFYMLMSGIYHQKGDQLKVVESYQKSLEDIPDNVQLSMLQATISEIDKEYDKALEIYESIVAKQLDIDLAVNNLVSLLSQGRL